MELRKIMNNENINKLTPITTLSNIETFKSDTKIEDSIYDFQNFLKENNQEIQKDKSNLETKIEKNSVDFSVNNIKPEKILYKKPNYEKLTKLIILLLIQDTEILIYILINVILL